MSKQQRLKQRNYSRDWELNQEIKHAQPNRVVVSPNDLTAITKLVPSRRTNITTDMLVNN